MFNFYFNNKALRGRASKPALIKGDSQKFYESEWIRTEKHSCVDDFELFELTKIIYNYETNGKKISDGTFVVDFAEISYPKSITEEIADFEFQKRNNVVSSIDLIMQENPDLTREQAMRKYNENKMLNQTFVTIQPAQQPTGV